MKIHALWLSASALTLSWCGAAAAQTAASDAEAAPADSEIVITAERRTANLQTTPIAATVLSGEHLANRGVTVVDQLQFISPAATVNNFGQGIDFNIRGIGKAEHNTQTTTGVITYRDNVATFPGYVTAEPYYDIASVEILRGPQGTFVGQNATGGAVFVTSNSPVVGGGVHGYLLGQAGNYNEVGAQGAVNIPLGDTLAARAAFYADKRDSFYDITGPYTGDEGVEIGALRFGLLWQPTSQLSVLFKTDLAYLDLSGYPSDPVNSPNDLFEITSNYDMLALDRAMRASLKIDYELANGITLRSVTGYQEARTEYRADLDGTSVGTSTFGDKVDEDIFSQEFNFISPDTGPVTWVLGLYYQEDTYDFPPGKFYIGLPTGTYWLDGENPKDAWAVFGQVGVGLTDKLELQVGARYAESTTTNHINIDQYGLPLTQDQREEYSNLSGKVALNYTLTPHDFFYGFVATGFRPGGLNVPVGLGEPAAFDEETVTSYELGYKAGRFDGALRTQIDAFYNEYDGFQVIVGYPTIPVFGFELNNPNTTIIYGFEAQAEAAFGKFSLDLGVGFIKTDLGKFFAVDPRVPSFGACDPETGPETPSCFNLEGRDQTYAPELTFNLGAQYVFDVGGGDTITPRVSYGHVSAQWATLFQDRTRGDRVGSRDIVNAQLAWQHGDIVATLFGTNITDQHYVGAINSGLRFAGAPRQYGVRLSKSF